MRRARERTAIKEAKRAQRFAKRAALGTGVALGAAVLFAPAAQGAPFEVTSLSDDGEGVTLREAIGAANANVNGATVVDDVNFADGLSGTITLTGGQIDIGEAVNVNGPGSEVITVSGNDSSRIFSVDTSPLQAVTISGLTLANGFADNEADGGAVAFYDTALTVVDSVLDGNETKYEGGAISGSGGSLTLTRSVVSDNIAAEEGGGISLRNQFETSTISYSVITRNGTDGPGGGLAFDQVANPVEILRTEISDNTAEQEGGGVDIDRLLAANESDDGGEFTVRESTISGNTAGADGGGVNAGLIYDSLLFENSTISGNTAEGRGGGVFVQSVDTYSNPDLGDNTEGDVTFLATTVAGGNEALGESGEPEVRAAGIAPADDPGGGIYLSSGEIALDNTIVADNVGGDLAKGSGANSVSTRSRSRRPSARSAGDAPRPFALDFSLVEDPGDAETDDVTSGSNIYGEDPRLGRLADYGGPTQTHLPRLSSPAIDQGRSFGLGTDQRGEPRRFDFLEIPNSDADLADAADMGAVERQEGDRDLAEGGGGGGGGSVPPGPGGAPVPPPGGSLGVCAGEQVTIAAAAGATTIGTPGRDVILGTAGEDVIRGGEGDDLICAGDGDDAVSGNDGEDVIRAGVGNDRVFGRDGEDRLSGNAGDDRVTGGDGADRLFGRGGEDRLSGGAGSDGVTGDGGSDVVSGNDGGDRLFGRSGDDRLLGRGGADRLRGNSGTDALRGGAGQDDLGGGPGPDTCAQDAGDVPSAC